MAASAALAPGAAVALAVLAAVAACQVPSGHPPVARIGIAPTAIPEGDSFQSPVVLDATMSADPIDDPEGTRPLAYHWEIIGDEFRVDAGSLDSATLTVRLLGDRPATIELTVTDGDGDSSTVREQLQLTLK